MKPNSKCSHCKGIFPLDVLVKLAKSKKTGKQYYQCRKCNTERHRIYRATAEGKANTFKAVYKSMKKHFKKQNARRVVLYHLKRGHLLRPKNCSVCKEDKRVEAHHEDHSKPLEIQWVCRQCHADIERQK